MHNCKATKELITELLLDGVQDQPGEVLACRDCQNEFDSLKETLRITTRQIETAAPSESYWNGYHVRLRQRIEAGNTQARTPALPASALPFWKRTFAKSVRIPLPVAAGLLLMFALSLFFVNKASKTETQVTATSISVVHVPVEVPVIQEKLVTRIVYRQSRRKAASTDTNQSNNASTLAKSQKASPVSLIGFKPLDEVRLTVIKGGSPDEK